MNYEIVEMREGTWRIEDGGVRFFLLAGREKALLIDSGMNVHNAKELAEGLTELPLELLNTHADRDHIGSNAEFERFYMHPDEEPLCRRNGLKGELLPLRDGDRLELGERPLRIFHLPGHTPGSIAVLDEKNRVLLSGDPIQRHGRIYLFGGHRDLRAYVRSLERLEGFTELFDEIWPSHAELPLEPSILPRLREGAQAVLDGKLPGTPTELHGCPIAAHDLGFCTLLCDR